MNQLKLVHKDTHHKGSTNAAEQNKTVCTHYIKNVRIRLLFKKQKN